MPSAVCAEQEATWPKLPLVCSWNQENPLPVRRIRHHRRPVHHPGTVGNDAPPWLATGPTDQPFDFTGHVRRLCADIVSRCEALGHIDVSQLLFAVTQARNGRAHGLQGRVTPLRMHHGQLTRRRRGVTYQIQRFFVDGREILYLVTFCLPRFLDLSFDEKFVTLFHELFHISPSFNGDLRRHDGRYSVHSHSQKSYDQQMAALAREYLAGRPHPDLHAFLRLDFSQLERRHGGVTGVVVPRPKLIPLLPSDRNRLEVGGRPAARQ
jgi:predicted metallopeptidase